MSLSVCVFDRGFRATLGPNLLHGFPRLTERGDPADGDVRLGIVSVRCRVPASFVEEETYHNVFAGLHRRRFRTSMEGKANEPEQLQTQRRR